MLIKSGGAPYDMHINENAIAKQDERNMSVDFTQRKFGANFTLDSEMSGDTRKVMFEKIYQNMKIFSRNIVLHLCS